MKGKLLVAALCAGTLITAGCETTAGGGGDSKSTLYDTHRMVSKLDKDLGGTVTKLNETTAELYALVNASDTEQRRMRSMVEENQVRVEQMQRELHEMKVTLYRHFNLSAPTSGASFGLPSDRGVTIEPPPGVVVDTGEYSGSAAVPVYEEVTINPSAGSSASPVTTTNVASGNPQEQYQLAQRAYANSDYKTALDLFDEYLQLYPSTTQASDAQFWKAKCQLDLQDYQSAIREFEVLRSRFPSSTKVPFAMHNQAVAHERLGQIPQARALLEDVIENYPVSPAADQARAGLAKLSQ